MKNKPLVFVLAGAVLFGILAVMSISRSNQSQAENLGQMVVAQVEIPLGTQLTPEQLTLVPLPKTSAPELSFTKVEDLTGRVVMNTIGPKESITEYRLAPKGSLAGLAALVPDGYRAMNVRVDDESGVAGLLSPGMVVDVVTVVRPADGRNLTIAKLALQNIKVLATGQNMNTPKEQVNPDSVRTVTLLVTPQEAEKLVMSSTDTRLRLLVRSYTDQNTAVTQGATGVNLLNGDAANPVPTSSYGQQPSALPPTTMPQPGGYLPPARRGSRPTAMLPANNYELEPTQKVSTAPPPPRVDQIEVFAGKEKKTVEFPK